MKYLLPRVLFLVLQVAFTFIYTEKLLEEEVRILAFYQSSISMLLWTQLGVPQYYNKLFLTDNKICQAENFAGNQVIIGILIFCLTFVAGLYMGFEWFPVLTISLSVSLMSFANLLNTIFRLNEQYFNWILTMGVFNAVSIFLIVLEIPFYFVLTAIFFANIAVVVPFRSTLISLGRKFSMPVFLGGLTQLTLNIGAPTLLVWFRWRGLEYYEDSFILFQRNFLVLSIIAIPMNLIAGLYQPVLLKHRSTSLIDFSINYIHIAFLSIIYSLLAYIITKFCVGLLPREYSMYFPLNILDLVVFQLPILALGLTVELVYRSKELISAIIVLPLLLGATALDFEPWILLETIGSILMFLVFLFITYLLVWVIKDRIYAFLLAFIFVFYLSLVYVDIGILQMCVFGVLLYLLNKVSFFRFCYSLLKGTSFRITQQ